MKPEENDYHISFFRPTTDNARRNRNLTVQLVLIWAVAIFGFQILLKILEKPVPEPVYTQFTEAWPAVSSGDFTDVDIRNVAVPALNVLGRVSIDPEHHDALARLVSWSAVTIADSSMRVDLLEAMQRVEEVYASINELTDPEYLAAKSAMVPMVEQIFGLVPGDVRARIATVELKSSLTGSFDDNLKPVVEEAMGFYLIHNRSVLTDTIFLGFPFHYFYTAVLLLILFVGLCWLYCVRTDMFHAKYEIDD
ncbi:MAG: DUF4212 domain-containing protein [Bacteroidales bacterium]|nr:DUF4212 domain-containing protein [Bacteroidales bacterium]